MKNQVQMNMDMFLNKQSCWENKQGKLTVQLSTGKALTVKIFKLSTRTVDNTHCLSTNSECINSRFSPLSTEVSVNKLRMDQLSANPLSTAISVCRQTENGPTFCLVSYRQLFVECLSLVHKILAVNRCLPLSTVLVSGQNIIFIL